MEWSEALSAELTEAVGSDAESLFLALVERHRERVYRVAIQMARSHEDADDIVQETFLRAYRSLSRFRGDSSMDTWIYRIVTNVALNHLRKRENSRTFLSFFKRETAGEGGACFAPSPSALVERDEERQAVRDAIASLPSPQRAAVVLFDLEGLPSGEVAEILGIPEGTVRSRLHHARKHLRKRLAPYLLGVQGETP